MSPLPFVFMEIVRMSYFFLSSFCECAQPRQDAQFPQQPPLPAFLRTICHTTTPTTNTHAATTIKISYHCTGYFSSFSSSDTANSAICSAFLSAAAFFSAGRFLFQSTIPTTTAAIAAAKTNAVHHQLPMR